MFNNFSGVCHRRDELRRHEGADFNLLESRCGERRDPGLLGLGRHQVVRVLQPVARPDLADVHLAHDGILAPGPMRFSIRPMANPQAAAPTANASSTQSAACQLPERDAIQAMAIGPRNCPHCEACMTMPFEVPMCCGVRGCTRLPAEIEAGMIPAPVAKASTSA